MPSHDRQVTASEFEAKCANPGGRVTVEDLIALIQNQFQVVPAVQAREQTDIYYDTPQKENQPGFRLGGSGLSLRVRRIEDQSSYELTAKRNISEIGGVFVREEVPVDLPLTSDIEQLINEPEPDSPPLQLIRKYIKGPLAAGVMVENHRTVIEAMIEGSRLRICHDCLTYSDFLTNQRIPDFEIEIELQGLNAQLMEMIVKIVRERFPILIAQRDDKYRRALKLLVGDLKERTLSYLPPKLERVTRREIDDCVSLSSQPYQSLLDVVAESTVSRLGGKSQLSVLPMPRDVRLALWSERTIDHLIEVNPFLWDSDPVLTQSCYISVDLPESPLKFFEHTRAQHSIDVACWTMRLARKCGLGEETIALLGCAGLRHDLGHPALCHSGEVVVQNVRGLDHEQRTLQMIEADAELLGRYDLSLQRLRSILREEGVGQILGLADTLAYLIRDGLACQRPLRPEVVQSISDNFVFDQSTNEIVLNDELLAALQAMLDFRFEMFRTVYYHPYSRIEEEMQQKAIRWALDHSVISLRDLLEGDDLPLLERMAEMAASQAKLKQLVAGFFPDYCAVYHYRPHVTYDGEQDVAELHQRLVSAGFDPLDFIISLPDTRAARKTISGRLPNGQAVEMQAQNVHDFHQYDSQTIVAFAPTIKHQDILRTLLRPR